MKTALAASGDSGFFGTLHDFFDSGSWPLLRNLAIFMVIVCAALVVVGIALLPVWRATDPVLGAPSGVLTDAPSGRVAAEDEIRSSPTLHKGVVFVGSYDTNLYALNAKSGEFVWKRATEGGIASSPAALVRA